VGGKLKKKLSMFVWGRLNMHLKGKAKTTDFWGTIKKGW